MKITGGHGADVVYDPVVRCASASGELLTDCVDHRVCWYPH